MTEKTWVEVSDWGTVKVGQQVRLEGGDESVEFELRHFRTDRSAGVPPVIKTTALASTRSLYWRADGWVLFVESTPNPLPTEPGVYSDSRGFPWGLNHAGKWSDFEGGKYADRLGYVEDPTIFGPFTRLESQADTARKVLERVAECVAVINSDDLHYVTNYVLPQVREEFGVVSS